MSYASKKTAKGSKRAKSTVLAKPPVGRFRLPATAGITRVSRRVGGGGDQLFASFIYSDKFTINPAAAGLLGVYQFSLNSLFDPNITGTGHQPVNFDQYALMFQQYQVYAVEVKATIWGPGSQMIAGITATRDSAPQTAFEQYVENGITQWCGTDAAASGQAVREFTMEVDLPAMWGLTKSQFLSDDRTRSTFGASPLEQAYLHCWACDAQLGDPGSHAWAVELRYHCKLTGSKLNNLS